MKNILYGGKRKPRLWAVLLISAMALTLLPVRLSPARAAMPATGDANDGVDFAALSTKGNGFYYGAYNHAVGLADGYYGMAIKDGTPTPILWRVMGEEAGVGYEGYITALSEYVLDSTNFYTDQSTNVYENSNIKSVLAAMVADTNNFPTAERNGMATVSVVTGMYSGAEMTGPQQPGPVDYPVISAAQTLYLPSGGDLGSSNVYWEAGNTRNAAYLLAANQNDNVATLKSGTGGNVIYLTRSPSPSYTNIAACVTTNGVGIMGRVDYVYGVRPAFKLDPASVIFASEIADAPTTAGQTLADADNYAESAGAANYKLTVLNTALSGGTMTADAAAFDSSGAHPAVPAASGGGVSVEATGAAASTKLTYKIVDGSHNIVGYGQGADSDELTVDAKDLAGADLAGGSYTVYVWAQKNNAIHSHEGSQPQWFTLEVSAPPSPPHYPPTVTPKPEPTPDPEDDFRFIDVAAGDWFHDEVYYAYDNGLMVGTGADTFSPNEPMTRGMLVTVLGRLHGADVAGRDSGAPFTDVDPDMYYAPYIAWAAENGIVFGVGNNRFEPERAIKREELAAALYRCAAAADNRDAGVLEVFSDNAKISDYARAPMAWAVGRALIIGMGDGTVNPQGQATRAQVAAVLHRFAENA